MHFNLVTVALCFLAVPGQVNARPTAVTLHARRVHPDGRAVSAVDLRRRNQRQQAQQAQQQVSCTAPPKQEAAAGEEAAKENEVEIESKFDTAVPVQGGELKQDLVFTPSTVGKFEYEFQGAAADEITVTENKTPGAPPTGFEAIEPNSYVVALAKSKGAGLTLSKIDYIFDTAAAGLAGKDITKAQVGRLCPETGAFVISETLGELEFEAEENEVTLNLNKNVTAEGEWGIFLPVAAAAGGAAAAAPEAPAEAAPKAPAQAAPKAPAQAAPKAPEKAAPKAPAEAAPKTPAQGKTKTPAAEAAPKTPASSSSRSKNENNSDDSDDED